MFQDFVEELSILDPTAKRGRDLAHDMMEDLR
jgi:hypothetical protein